MASKLKILVVDDSAFMRLLVTDLLSEDSQIEVVGTATNGLEATKQVLTLKPDIVLLDLNMADYDGLYAVKAIMESRPTPILILSSVGNTDLQPIFEALKNGAVDYINKPDRNKSKMRELQKELIQKIKSTSRAKPKTITAAKKTVQVVSKKRGKKKSNYDLVAIGASTGGPTAIERVLSSLPADFDIPIIVCQHMPAVFIPQFVQRLSSLTNLEVVSATKGAKPTPGVVMFCPGHANLILTKKNNEAVIDFTDEVYPDYNNPSINAMMLSAAKIYKNRMVGVLLTGMGKDGVKGMIAVHEAKGKTIAQNKESSVIYGMPKAANESGAVDEILDIKEIGNYLVNDL
ncbi:two-component system, chemotaxis family, response regulator CheB [Ekhidna lutea]|uniref:Protein-glutamate methylesterase/protein-glutamine glutaminase n=1 Tax=Ekhidna lutea TaxID=447679 RepID=A0A239H152_EKHLU|nr:chemotaxis-specific protein-glutamate methyltransferase CheB [Ekhidna lutea]SNS75196.1 two-component system, chemotaxis family, response regulator CheB [Ekhidna lutea]